MAERLKKHLFWFSLVLGGVTLLGLIALIHLVQLTGVDPAYLIVMLLLCYPIYLCAVAYGYRGKVDQSLVLSPLPFQIYFWMMVLNHVLSLMTGDFSGKALSIGMTIWAYHIIKQVKDYNLHLLQAE